MTHGERRKIDNGRRERGRRERSVAEVRDAEDGEDERKGEGGVATDREGDRERKEKATDRQRGR